MKKLLTILVTISLTAGATTTLIACTGSKSNNATADTTTTKDAKVLNDIANMTTKYFLDFLGSNQFIDVTEYGSQVFKEFFNSVSAAQPTVAIKADDKKFQEGISSINAIFKTYLNQINIKIAQEYSNVYVNSYPLTWNLDKNSSMLGYIDLIFKC